MNMGGGRNVVQRRICQLGTMSLSSLTASTSPSCACELASSEKGEW